MSPIQHLLLEELQPIRRDLFFFPEGSKVPVALLGGRCTGCGEMNFPFPVRCRSCLADAILEQPLSVEGEVVEWTTVRRGVPGFPTPYHVGYVLLPDGIQVFTQFLLEPGEELRPGQSVQWRLYPIPTQEDGPVLGYVFEPIHGQGSGSESKVARHRGTD